MADLLQTLAADVIAGAGVSLSEPISNHPDLLRRYTELSKVIQVWNTEGDKTAVRREVNLIKAQLSYNKEVVGAQKTFATNNMKERGHALKALTDLERALVAASGKLTDARNTQSEYIMHKVAKVANRLGSRGSGARAWTAINGILGEEGLIGRVPDPALPLLLARMKATYGDSGLGPSAQQELEILTARAKQASVVQQAALERNKRALQTVESLTSRAGVAGNNSSELAQVIKEARGFSGKMAAFMEKDVGLTNKAELAARLDNLQGQSDTLGRLEERHKALDELLGRGGGSSSERQKLANMVSHPRFRAWAESNGYEANALGIANRASDGGGAVLTSYVSGRDDLKAVLHFQHQLQNPDSYRSILSPFGQRSRSGKYVVVTDKVSVENARGLVHKNGRYAKRWVSLGEGTANPRMLSESQYLEHAQKYVHPQVWLLQIGDTRYARSGGTYYKYLPGTREWAQQSGVPEGVLPVTQEQANPLTLVVDGKYTRFASVGDLMKGGNKAMATRESGSGLKPIRKADPKTGYPDISKLGGVITEHTQLPDGMVATYAGELLTQHAIDVRNSRDKGAVDIKVHGLNGIRTFSGDAPITIDIVQKDDETGLSDIYDAWSGAGRAETARGAEPTAPTNIVTTKDGPHTIIDRGNEEGTWFSDARQKIVSAARGDTTEGPASEEEQERFRLEQEELALVPEQAAPVEGIRGLTQAAVDPTTLEEPGTPSDRPLVSTPAEGGPVVPRQKYGVSVVLKSGETKIAGITADSPEDAERLVAEHYGDKFERVEGPPFVMGDPPGTYAAVGGPERAASVAAHARAQKISTPLAPVAGDELVVSSVLMPELDRLRAMSDMAQAASAADRGNRDLKAAARAAKKTYEKAADEQLKDKAERRRHAAGESIEKIQAAPPAPAPVAAPAPAPIDARAAFLKAARNIGVLEAGGDVGYSSDLSTSDQMVRAQALLENRKALWLAEKDVDETEVERQTQAGISQGRTTHQQKLQAEQRERGAAEVSPPSAKIDTEAATQLYRDVSGITGERAPPTPEIRREPYTTEQAAWSSYKAADKAFKAAHAEGGSGLEPSRVARLGAMDKYRDEWLGLNPGATEQDFMRALNVYKGIAPLPPLSPPPQAEARGDIGAKLRGILGLGPSGQKAEAEADIKAPVQEQASAPSEPEVHGKSGPPAQKPPRKGGMKEETWVEGQGWVDDDDDDEDDE